MWLRTHAHILQTESRRRGTTGAQAARASSFGSARLGTSPTAVANRPRGRGLDVLGELGRRTGGPPICSRPFTDVQRPQLAGDRDYCPTNPALEGHAGGSLPAPLEANEQEAALGREPTTSPPDRAADRECHRSAGERRGPARLPHVPETSERAQREPAIRKLFCVLITASVAECAFSRASQRRARAASPE